jgi:hypothetical protein
MPPNSLRNRRTLDDASLVNIETCFDLFVNYESRCTPSV